MRRYEGMFLFDSGTTRDWNSIEQEVRRLCDRIGAQLLVCVKFDERKLAYEIKKRKRGTYVLTYFDAPPERLPDLERDVQLSDVILRALFLRADGLTEERLAELRARPPEVPLAPSGDGRRHDEGRERRKRGERDTGGAEAGPDTLGGEAEELTTAESAVTVESVPPVDAPPSELEQR